MEIEMYNMISEWDYEIFHFLSPLLSRSLSCNCNLRLWHKSAYSARALHSLCSTFLIRWDHIYSQSKKKKIWHSHNCNALFAFNWILIEEMEIKQCMSIYTWCNCEHVDFDHKKAKRKQNIALIHPQMVLVDLKNARSAYSQSNGIFPVKPSRFYGKARKFRCNGCHCL